MAVLADLALKTTALLILAAAITLLMRRASAASRHLVWSGMFGAMLLLPVARLALPAIRVAVLTSQELGQVLPDTALVSAPDGVAFSGFTAREAPPFSKPGSLSTASAGVARSPAWTPSRLVAAGWMAGTGLIGLRMILGILSARRLARRARRLDDDGVLRRVEWVRLRLSVRRQIRVLASPDQRMPVTWGVVHPVILLPSGMLPWNVESRERLDEVLAHETAHIARWDAMSQFIARLGVAVFWFNPLMWIAARQARLERERACDDVVLGLGSTASNYAGHLLDVARSLAAAAVTCPGALAMARRSQLERRVQAILDERTDRRGVTRASFAVTSALVGVMVPVSAVCLTARPRPITAPIFTVVDMVPPAAPPPVGAPVAHHSGEARPKPTRSSADAPAPPSILMRSQAQRSSPAIQQVPANSPPLGTWLDEREAMMRQLLDRAQGHLYEMKMKVEIGTLAQIDTSDGERTVAEIEQMLVVAVARKDGAGAPSEAEMAAVRQRFSEALRSLDAVETRFTAGMTTVRALDAAVLAAADVLRKPPSAAPASGADTPMTDAALIAALKDAATIASDTDRANTLLALAQRNALSAEMVALYVAAASGITSDAERARVFAQPIRVKPIGR